MQCDINRWLKINLNELQQLNKIAAYNNLSILNNNSHQTETIILLFYINLITLLSIFKITKPYKYPNLGNIKMSGDENILLDYNDDFEEQNK